MRTPDAIFERKGGELSPHWPPARRRLSARHRQRTRLFLRGAQKQTGDKESRPRSPLSVFDPSCLLLSDPRIHKRLSNGRGCAAIVEGRRSGPGSGSCQQTAVC